MVSPFVGSGLDLSPTELAKRNGCPLCRHCCRGRHWSTDIVHALAFVVGGSHQDPAGVLATARSIVGHPTTPARTVATSRTIRIQQCLVGAASAGRIERPAFRNGGAAHAARWKRRRPS